jgi:hypothetical protein
MRDSVLESPLGREGFMELVRFVEDVGGELGGGGIEEPAGQLAEYFAGRRREFELRVRLEGTAFQKRVWGALREIGHGKTPASGELARRTNHVHRVAGPKRPDSLPRTFCPRISVAYRCIS